MVWKENFYCSVLLNLFTSFPPAIHLFTDWLCHSVIGLKKFQNCYPNLWSNITCQCGFYTWELFLWDLSAFSSLKCPKKLAPSLARQNSPTWERFFCLALPAAQASHSFLIPHVNSHSRCLAICHIRSSLQCPSWSLLEVDFREFRKRSKLVKNGWGRKLLWSCV